MSKKWKIGFDPANGGDKPCLIIADLDKPEGDNFHIRHISHSWEQTATQLAFVMGKLDRLQAIVGKQQWISTEQIPEMYKDIVDWRSRKFLLWDALMGFRLGWYEKEGQCWKDCDGILPYITHYKEIHSPVTEAAQEGIKE